MNEPARERVRQMVEQTEPRQPKASKDPQKIRRLNGPGEVDTGAPARRPLNWKRIEENPPGEREWFAHGWAGPNQTVLLPGAGGVGKSLLSQQFGSEQSLGRSGILPAARAITVLAWFGEDDEDEIARRQLALAKHLNVRIPDFQDRFIAESLDGRDATLAEKIGGMLEPTRLMDELREQVHDYRADLVILDNMARMFGGNENDRHEVTRFCAWLRGRVGRAALILLAHPGRASGSEYSGSSAWEAAVRSRWFLGRTLPDQKQTEAEEEAEGADTTRWLCRRKANYSPRDYVRLEYRDGVFMTDAPQVATGGLMDSLRASRARRVVLEGLRAVVAMGKIGTDAQNSPNFLPRQILGLKLHDGCTERELRDAMRDHLRQGLLRVDTVGKYANRSPMRGLIEVPRSND
jgi:hypothetical protein